MTRCELCDVPPRERRKTCFMCGSKVGPCCAVKILPGTSCVCAPCNRVRKAGADLVEIVKEAEKVCAVCHQVWIVLHTCPGAPS